MIKEWCGGVEKGFAYTSTEYDEADVGIEQQGDGEQGDVQAGPAGHDAEPAAEDDGEYDGKGGDFAAQDAEDFFEERGKCHDGVSFNRTGVWLPMTVRAAGDYLLKL